MYKQNSIGITVGQLQLENNISQALDDDFAISFTLQRQEAGYFCDLVKHPVEPPSCITGVEMTKREEDEQKGASACLDYFRFTFPDSVSLSSIIEFLNIDGWVELPYGRYNYRAGQIAGHVSVYHSGQEGMGTCVEISGQGCRQLESSGRVTDWQAFVRQVHAMGGKYTRFDVALDDKVGLLGLDTIKEAMLKKTYSGHMTTFEPHEKYDLRTGKYKHRELRLGSRTSENYIRVYDKALEQRVEGHWIRFEIEVKGDRANLVAMLFADQGMSPLLGYIRSVIDFKEEGATVVKSRWRLADWWVAFLEGADKVRLKLETKQANLDQITRWLYKQVSASLALYLESEGGDLDSLLKLIDYGRPRINPIKRSMCLT